MEKTDFNKNLSGYLKSRRKQKASLLGKLGLFGKKKNEADIPEEAIKELLESKSKRTTDNNGTDGAENETVEKIEHSREEINPTEEKNKDAVEIMDAIESILHMLPPEEQSRFNEAEELKNFRKNTEQLRQNKIK